MTEVPGSHPGGFKGSIPSGSLVTILPTAGHVGLGWVVRLLDTCLG